MMLERMPCFAEVRKNRFYGFPETRAVIHLTKMRKFVSNHVVNDRHGEMDQPPVEADLAVAGTTAPTRGRRRQRIRPELYPQFGRVHRQPLAENLQCLRVQPALHTFANLLDLGTRGKAEP